jgi:hypothetical protein
MGINSFGSCRGNDLEFIKEHTNDAKKNGIFFVADLLYTGMCVFCGFSPEFGDL